MPAFFSKKQYGFRLLLNEGRAFQRLIKTGQGETQIWEWIDDLVCHASPGLELPLKQKLLKASLDHDLAPALMLASAGNRFPVIVRTPGCWRSCVRAHGTNVHFMSALLWQAEVLRKFIDGLRTYRRLSRHAQQAPSGNYAVLSGLHGSTYTSALRNDNAQDFLAWFRKRFAFTHYWIIPASAENYTSAGNCSWVASPFPALPAEEKFAFLSAAQKIICAALLRLCVGQWHEAYMLSDRLEEIYMRHVPTENLAKMYAFTNAAYIYRPLWTYEVERRGAEVALFFYSTNTFNMALAKGGGNGNAPGYSQMAWPHIYTQHENHKIFLQDTMLRKADIKIVGPIPYEDNAADINLPGQLKILYLDVQPFRAAFMASIGRPCHLYTEEVSREAFQDIVLLAGEQGAALFIKPKRNVGKRLSPAYRKMLLETEQKKFVKIIDPYISARQLCEKADIVICQPFTTAALFAQVFGKPVAYYDAQGVFADDQLAAQGITLLKGRAALETWLSQQISKNSL